MQNDMISCVISNAERFLHIKKKKKTRHINFPFGKGEG